MALYGYKPIAVGDDIEEQISREQTPRNLARDTYANVITNNVNVAYLTYGFSGLVGWNLPPTRYDIYYCEIVSSDTNKIIMEAEKVTPLYKISSPHWLYRRVPYSFMLYRISMRMIELDLEAFKPYSKNDWPRELYNDLKDIALFKLRNFLHIIDKTYQYYDHPYRYTTNGEDENSLSSICQVALLCESVHAGDSLTKLSNQLTFLLKASVCRYGLPTITETIDDEIEKLMQTEMYIEE